MKRKLWKLFVFLCAVSLIVFLLWLAGHILIQKTYAVQDTSPTVPLVFPPRMPVAPVLTQKAVRDYITAESLKLGVNPEKSLWIINHESGACWMKGYYDAGIVGPEPNGSTSWGCWQINDRNEDFNFDCATDLICSTQWSLHQILNGNINRWTTYSFRFQWFPDQNPPL